MAFGDEGAGFEIGESPSDLNRIAFEIGSLAVVEDRRDCRHGPVASPFSGGRSRIGWTRVPFASASSSSQSASTDGVRRGE